MARESTLRVVHLCYSDERGGAAIGARRSHQAMCAMGIDSRLVVVAKYGSDERVIELPQRPRVRKYLQEMEARIAGFQRSDNPIIRTFNVLPLGTAAFLNRLQADIVQMHWVAANTISIGEIAALNKPVVWKLPDMWPFSGAEHYLLPGDHPRYRNGYDAQNRQSHESGLDIDRVVWAYKKFRWRKADFSIVGPSRWIAKCAGESALFGHRRIRHIPNPLDTELYKPTPMEEARHEFGLPLDKRLVMFGAMYATRDRRKGFHHLERALEKLHSHLPAATNELVIVGADGDSTKPLSGYKVHYLGTIRDEERLARAYNTADVFVLPAEADNLPNVVKEAICCGVPCVGFDIGGMPDLVAHGETGYLAKPYDADELAQGIAWTAARGGPELRAEVRRRAVAEHSQSVAVGRYVDFYDEILAHGSRTRRGDVVPGMLGGER